MLIRKLVKFLRLIVDRTETRLEKCINKVSKTIIHSQWGTIAIKLTKNPCISETEQIRRNLIPLYTKPYQTRRYKFKVSEY